jgi:hypothetical protein
MTLNHFFSLTTFALVALCFGVFVSTRPLYALGTAGQTVVATSSTRLQRINDECEKTYGVNSSQSVDCFFITLTERMAASQPATRQAQMRACHRPFWYLTPFSPLAMSCWHLWRALST